MTREVEERRQGGWGLLIRWPCYADLYLITPPAGKSPTSHEALIFILDEVRRTLQRCTGPAVTIPSLDQSLQSTQETVLPRKHPGSHGLNHDSRITGSFLHPLAKLAQTRFTNHNRHPLLQDVLLVQTRLRMQTRDVRFREVLHGSQPYPDTMQEEEYLADDQNG